MCSISFLSRFIQLSIVLILILNCSSSLPLRDFALAKTSYSKASALQAERFTGEDVEKSKKLLLDAQEEAATNNPSLEKIKSLTEESTRSSFFALEKTVPLLSSEYEQDASKSIQEAEIAYAEKLSPEFFNISKIQFKDAKNQSGQIQDDIKNKFPENNEKKLLRYDDLELAFEKFKLARLNSEKAKNLSLAQIPAILENSKSIESNLNLAEKISDSSNTPKILEIKNSYTEAIKDLESGNIKLGFSKIEKSREDSRLIQTSIIIPYIHEKQFLAEGKIAEAGESLGKVKINSLPPDEKIQTDYAETKAYLRNARSFQDESKQLEKSEKLNESLIQAEEALKLAEVVVLKSKNLSIHPVSKSNRNVEEENTVSLKKSKQKIPAEKIEYKVKKEESLSAIAKKTALKNPGLWKEIYKLNKSKIKNPNIIYPNQVIYIPGEKGKMQTKKKSLKSKRKKSGSMEIKEETFPLSKKEAKKTPKIPKAEGVEFK